MITTIKNNHYKKSVTMLVLASTSPSRQKILGRLKLPFIVASPDCDETSLAGEDAESLVLRLSKTKAQSLVCHYPNQIIIGADQVCVIDHEIKGKPHTVENAKQQLLLCSGKKITFYTGMTVIDGTTQHIQQCCEPFNVYFRQLTEREIEGYIHKEQPFSCAGSFKCDALGITLFERLEGDDFNALIGLPLIKLTQFLMNIGVNPLLI